MNSGRDVQEKYDVITRLFEITWNVCFKTSLNLPVQHLCASGKLVQPLLSDFTGYIVSVAERISLLLRALNQAAFGCELYAATLYSCPTAKKQLFQMCRMHRCSYALGKRRRNGVCADSRWKL